MTNNFDLMERNETNELSRGGTELLQERLYDGSVPRELIEKFQIVFSRTRELDPNRFRIFYAHDLANDPEANNALLNDGWKKYHKIVFVSNWQMQQYISFYQIPWSHCEVIENSIEPIDYNEPWEAGSKVRLCYTSTPHRGLDIVYAVFNELAKTRKNIELDVFSSFNLYGWGERDKQFKDLFDLLEAHPQINYHGTVANEELRDYLAIDADIFVHPGTWPETSCLCLIEAMSAGLMCVHSNFAALADTSADFTYMYQFEENPDRHATKLFHILSDAIDNVNSEQDKATRHFMRMYANKRFNWKLKQHNWNGLLSSIVALNPDKSLPADQFVYRA